MSILVTTPTGQVGSRVARRLLDAGADVRVLVRDPARLPDDVRARADVRTGDLGDAASLRAALEGASQLFLVIPPHYAAEDFAAWQRAVARGAADAVRGAGVRRVVLLSSGGAHRDDLGPISRLGEAEALLNAAAPGVAALRAGFFFENFLSAVPAIRAFGSVFLRPAADARLPMVATADIGDAAAARLLDPAWSGHHVQGVHGPAHLTLAEATAALAAGIGRPLAYVQATDEQTRDALVQHGATPAAAADLAAMYARLGEVGMDGEPRSAETTTPTRLEDWARTRLRPLVDAGEPVTAA
jgi:uncharacterized protein YbjT (DUF2867 family)